MVSRLKACTILLRKTPEVGRPLVLALEKIMSAATFGGGGRGAGAASVDPSASGSKSSGTSDGGGSSGIGGREEAINTPFCPLQENFHTFVSRGLRNISEAP